MPGQWLLAFLVQALRFHGQAFSSHVNPTWDIWRFAAVCQVASELLSRHRIGPSAATPRAAFVASHPSPSPTTPSHACAYTCSLLICRTQNWPRRPTPKCRYELCFLHRQESPAIGDYEHLCHCVRRLLIGR
ncbi:hypothetical protein LZ31DRAFT_186928 [Colletotrichum somersetense]|nr:hypothetical protein LZ31DRAFT_186928 [Colletotrichum somersetense]